MRWINDIRHLTVLSYLTTIFLNGLYLRSLIPNQNQVNFSVPQRHLEPPTTFKKSQKTRKLLGEQAYVNFPWSLTDPFATHFILFKYITSTPNIKSAIVPWSSWNTPDFFLQLVQTANVSKSQRVLHTKRSYGRNQTESKTGKYLRQHFDINGRVTRSAHFRIFA